MVDIAADTRYAWRTFTRNPGFALVALITLALGIGANTAIFSVVDGVLLRPAPFAAVEELVMVWETDRHTGTTREPASLPDFVDLRTRTTQLGELAAFMGREVNHTPASGEPARLAAVAVTHEFLPMLGLQPVLGRVFSAEETVAGGPRVALVSERFWTRTLARDPQVLGQTIRLDDLAYTVIGVMPNSSDFGIFQILSAADYSRAFADRGARADVELWLPLQENEQSMPRATHPILLVGRQQPTATLASVQDDLATIAADLERDYSENDGRGVFVEPLDAIIFGPIRPALLVLLGAVTLVLLVACTNVANLLLARGAARRREVAVRTALGAGAGRLARQFLVESLLLTVVAAALGVAVAWLGLEVLVRLAPADIPRIVDVGIDPTALGVTLSISILVGLAFGMLPTLQARQLDLHGSLKAEGGRGGSAGLERRHLRSMLVVAEVALAVVLVIGAALLIKSFWRLQRVDPGFEAERIVKAEYQLPPARYPRDFSRFPDFQEMHAFTDAVLRRARTIPGVEAAAVAGNHPLDQGFTNSFTIVGREAESRTWPEISVRRVTPGYFETTGLPLVRGRLLEPADSTTAAPVALLNSAAAQRFFGDQDPVGHLLSFWGADRTIVGVVANERFHGLEAAPPLAAYLPLAQAPSANGAGVLLVRTVGDTSVASALSAAIRAEDAGLAVFGVERLSETVVRSIAERRFTMLVLSVFAGVALVLAVVGVYGVLSYAVAQRTREIGIRMALGARPTGVIGLVVGSGVRLSLAGVGIGLLGAWAVTRLLASLLFGVTPTDLGVFVGVPALLMLAALAAAYVPARRATHVDPVTALRVE